MGLFEEDDDIKLDNHPLNKAFNIDMEGLDVEDEPNDDIGITQEEIDLEEVIRQSKFIYNNLASDLPYIEPKHKPMHYQMMERMLSEIKDAIWKKESIKLNREKFEHQKSKHNKKGSDDGEVDASSSDPANGVERAKLFSIK